MAIIEKDGFEFYESIAGYTESFIVTGKNLENEIKYIKENKINSISLSFFKSKEISNLDFLSKVEKIEKISISDLDIDYAGLYYLKELKYAILSVKNSSQYLDYSRFNDLGYLSIDWYSKFPDLSDNDKLKHLVVWKYKPKSKCLAELKLPKGLESLEITESNILNLEGLTITNLINFEGHYCNLLESLRGLSTFNSKLEVLILDYCRKLTDYEELKTSKSLSKIILGDCGNMPTLKWLTQLKNVKHFSFWNTELTDGDTSPCFGIDYVSFKNRKHYNHLLEEF